MKNRKNVPQKLRRELMAEAGWRCAIPTCRVSSPLQLAHIDPVENEGENDFFNMIVLCSNCHGRFDNKNEKYMTRDAIINIKKNLMILNGRYGSFEIRVMEYFLENSEKNSIQLFDRDFDVMYLIKDGLIAHDGKRGANAINLPPKTYLLTEKGKKFLERWKSAILFDQ